MGVYMHLCKNVLSCTFKICVLTICKLHQKNSKEERERKRRKSRRWEVGREGEKDKPLCPRITKSVWATREVTPICKLHQKNSKKERERKRRKSRRWEVQREGEKDKPLCPRIRKSGKQFWKPLVFVTNDFTDFITFFLSQHVPDYKES